MVLAAPRTAGQDGDRPIRFADFSEWPPEAILPLLDRSDTDETGLDAHQLSWRRDGVVNLPGFVPDSLTEPYIRRRAAHPNPAGWLTPTPYMHILEMRDLALYPPLMAILRSLIGEQMILHLCLTGWESTNRAWHQDDYLNPPDTHCWYAAVWFALGDIHAGTGAFEYVRGSHRWPLMRGEKVRQFLSEEELSRRAPGTGINHWERFAERFTTPAVEAEIAARGAEIVPFLARRGDVLIWHSRLMHRGAPAAQLGTERRSLITHYSAASRRPEYIPGRDQNGELYAIIDTPLVG